MNKLSVRARITLKFLAGFFFTVLLFSFAPAEKAAAAVAAGFSFGVGEEYNDNIFFTKGPKGNANDWITHIVPTFSILYASPGDPTPVLTATLSPEGQIFARHSRENNFADNIAFNSSYIYRFSPNLTFNFVDTLNRQGRTRTIGLDAMGPPPPLPATPTQSTELGTFVPLPLIQDIGTLITTGRSITNSFTAQPVYRYSPVFTITGGYSLGYSKTDSGTDFTHSAGVRGVYNWRQDHNLFAGYTINVFDSGRKTTVIHNIDIGDDYFTGLRIRLAPTWTLSGAFGLAFNFGGTGPTVVNNVNVTLIKLWENANLNFAIRRGLTTTVGLFSGPSTTTVFSAGYGIRLTERLTGLVGADYSLLGEHEADIEIFRASAGLQYWINNWLSSNLWYSRRWRSAGPTSVDVPGGRVGGDSVLLSVTAHFDLYPNPGLARGALHPLYAPMGAPIYERTELQQPLRAPTAPSEMREPLQQPLQQPLTPEGVKKPPPPPREESQPEAETPK